MQSLFTNDAVFTVTSLNEAVKNALEGQFFSVNLEGEISGFRRYSSGHLYFTLKDDKSEISAVMFRSSVSTLSFSPKDGDKVRVAGRVTIFTDKGRYQIICTKMALAGVGGVLERIEKLKQALSREGLFSSEHKKKLPRFPKTIGVVTSPSGAAFHDIVKTVRRRDPTVSVILFPALVQGEGAKEDIVRSIRLANEKKPCDVLIIGRGGGSVEDLLPFSEEAVVRAIYQSLIPTISAVGHEIDYALSDFVADVRAVTPTAAAEIAVPEAREIIDFTNQVRGMLFDNVKVHIEKYRTLLSQFKKENLEQNFRNIEFPVLSRYESAKERLEQGMKDALVSFKTRFDNSRIILSTASPEAIFKRGYSMVTLESSGEVVRDGSIVPAGAVLRITPSRGSFRAKKL